MVRGLRKVLLMAALLFSRGSEEDAMETGLGRTVLVGIAAAIAAGCTRQIQPGADQSAAAASVGWGVPAAHAQAFPEQDSRAACEKAIEATATHRPPSLDVHRFSAYATRIDSDGNRTVIQEFMVKNRRGHTVAYRARCVIQPSGHLEISMSPAS